MSDRFAFLDHPGVLAFAHRGGTSDWPENTMPAFQHSIDLGYQYLETDVHLSADGVLFAFHDDNLADRTGINASFGDLDAAEIDQLLVDGSARIPRLDEILTTWPCARINIDTKSDATVLPLIDTIQARQVLDRVCIGSFSDRRIKKCRRVLGPGLCTSMGPLEIAQLLLVAKGLGDPRHLHAACAQLPVAHVVTVTDASVVEAAHAAGIQVHVWTIDEPDEMHRLLDLGVDGLMTDCPRVLRHELIGRNLWAQGRKPTSVPTGKGLG